MSTTYTCEWCGEEIEGDGLRGVATVSTHGLHADTWLVGRESRHFHAGEHDAADSCLLRALTALDAPDGSRRHLPKEIARKQAETVWKETSRERREAPLLHVLGDEKLLIRELAQMLNQELGFPQPETGWAPKAVWDSEVRSLVMRLLREGQLERQPERFNKSHTRYRYSCRRALDGPIADLDRAYRDDGEAVA